MESSAHPAQATIANTSERGSAGGALRFHKRIAAINNNSNDRLRSATVWVKGNIKRKTQNGTIANLSFTSVLMPFTELDLMIVRVMPP